MSARADPCGGRSAMIFPTATSLTCHRGSTCAYRLLLLVPDSILLARCWFHGGRLGDCKTAAACLGFGVGQQRRPHSPGPDQVARCGHVQIVRVKEILRLAI